MSASSIILRVIPVALAAVSLSALGAMSQTEQSGTDSCVECHRELEPRLAKPTVEFRRGIHAKRGLDCTACHGGDASDPDMTAMDPDKGFRGKPSRHEIAGLCASCHANAQFMKRYNPKPYIFSVAEWQTSVHCKLEAEGDVKVATCTNCHGSHGILPHTDIRSPVHHQNVPATCANCHNAEYMKGRTVPTDQFAEYITSVHGKALLEKGDPSAPACNDCHGNHGAAPPGVENMERVCGKCHGREAELFFESPMRLAMEELGMPACLTCHGNHAIQHPGSDRISVDEDGWCGDCHSTDSDGERGTLAIIEGFNELERSVAESDSLLHRAETLGMETETGRNAWKEAQNRIIGARATLHSFNAERITSVTTEGIELASQARARATEALRDWRNRRLGMGVSVVVILVLIGILMVKIRTKELA